jgi:hypothetical protein
MMNINDIKFHKIKLKACDLTWIHKLAAKRGISAYWQKRAGISALD